MIRTITGKLAKGMLLFAHSDRYPTRTVEHAFAWIVIVWSYSVLAHNHMLSGRVPGGVYGPMLDVMSAKAWGVVGMIIGVTRVLALFGNGHWGPSPELRLAGAAWGLMFWGALSYCYFIAIDINGGPDFPMRRAFFVLIFFEAYSCYRCGQDIGKRQQNKRLNSEPSRSMGADYG